MMTERQLRELEVQVARYRALEREVTDPLAGYLLHSIVLELEADLQDYPSVSGLRAPAGIRSSENR
jgi:hypothetical protein